MRNIDNVPINDNFFKTIAQMKSGIRSFNYMLIKCIIMFINLNIHSLI